MEQRKEEEKKAGLKAFVGNPWDRQPGENEMSFHRFTIYRDMAFERSLGSVAKLEMISYTRVKQLADKYRWEERALAYDVDQDRTIQAALTRQATKTRMQHFKLAASLLTKAAQKLTKLTPDEMSARDLISALNTAVDLQRQALGLPSNSTVHAELTGKDGADLPATPSFYNVTLYLPANGRSDKSPLPAAGEAKGEEAGTEDGE